MCFVSPTFSGVDIFCNNAYSIHWTMGAIFLEFSQLILMEIINIVATRCQFLRLKCTQFNFGWGSVPDSARGAYSAPPDPWLDLKGLLLRGGEGK